MLTLKSITTASFILPAALYGQTFIEAFNTPPNYSNKWLIASQTGSPTVTYSPGLFRIQALNGCVGPTTGIEITFRSNQTFAGDLDVTFQLNHGGWGRTSVGLWSQNQDQPVISSILDTDDTAYLAFGSGNASTQYEYSSAPYLNRPITLRIQMVGNNVNFYADNGSGPALLQTWPAPVSPSPDVYSLFFSVGSVCWKSGANDTSFNLITATSGEPFQTTLLFDAQNLTQNGFLGDISTNNPTVLTTTDSSGAQHTYHSFVIMDNTDLLGNPLGLDHTTFRLSLSASGTGSLLTLSIPSGGDTTDTNSGGGLQAIVPFGLTINAITGTNVSFGNANSPITTGFDCAFGVIAGSVVDQLFHNVYSGYQLLECTGLGRYITIQQAGDSCSPVYPIVNNQSAACLDDPQNHSLYGDKVLNTHQFRKLLWKPEVDGLSRSDLLFHIDQLPSQVLKLIQKKGVTFYINTPRGDFWVDNFH